MSSHRPLRLLAVTLLAAAAAVACTRDQIMRRVVVDNGNYFAPAGYRGTALERITDGVYSFRWTWYRNLIVVTRDGLFVTDPFNPAAARAMAAALARELPGRPVHTLLYSHYHIDHVAGGAALSPRDVICHRRCPDYWRRIDARGVLEPTRLIDGDVSLTIGGEQIRLIYLGDSHTDTLYAVYLPRQRVLWTADFAFVRAYPPFGIPDAYGPGLRDAGARLARLDFDWFVPSHFGIGRKRDFLDAIGMVGFHRDLAREALARFGPPTDETALGRHFDFAYPRMRRRYGNWHGFRQQALDLYVHSVARELLGY